MKKILCIDDDRDILESLELILGKEGYKVLCGKNSNEGLNLAKKAVPDLIILDVMMDNDTDGFQLAYQFRTDVDLRHIPILMLTSVNQKTGFKFNPATDGDFLPVNEFMEKPFIPGTLVQKVKELLSPGKEKTGIKMAKAEI